MRFRLFALACLLFIAPAHAGIKETISALAPSGLVFVLDEQGKALAAQNADRPFVPASVTKVVTAWLALDVLGADYRFQTRFYLDKERMLYVRGGGDPFLVSEELALLAPALLKATGKEPFAGIVVDGSYFPTRLRIPGIKDDNEAYNALNTALAVNFNTIHARRNGKTVRSAEEQTPITPLAIKQFRARGPNGRGRISLAQEDPSVSLLYAGELLAAFIKKSGGDVSGPIKTGTAPKNLKPVHTHRQSRPLSEILRLMLVGSNNYIANQVFLEIGAHKLGAPASLDKSLKVAGEILRANNLADGIHLVEGSGISPENKFTARGMAGVLHRFAPHAKLMKRSKAGSRYKTGSISGVRTLAGYAVTSKHGTVRFVIALGGGSGKLRFRLLREIEKGL